MPPFSPMQPELLHDEEPSGEGAPGVRADALPAREPVETFSHLLWPTSLDHTIQEGTEAPGHL
eukprot:12487784-Alexandrium_andersonii.AAC.1